MDRSAIERAVGSCELFRGLGKGEIRKISSLCHVETYDAGEDVFRQGDVGKHLYIIAEGQIFLERSMDLGTRTGKVVIGILGRGRAFGCWSTLLDEPHNVMSSAICQKPAELVVMKGADLREMMIRNAKFGFSVLERLCFVLRDRLQGAFGAMEKI
ncbi:MAG: cyclic nucleotide-binding domain-containing protein [Pseudomonadota bacterium]